MKKLMIAAIAVASCTAFAMDKKPGVQGEISPIDPGVYNVSMTYQYLAAATQKKSAAQNTRTEDPYPTPEKAIEAGNFYYNDVVLPQFAGYEEDCDLVSVDFANKKVGRETLYTWKISYIAPALTRGVASTKVVSTTIDGLCFVKDVNSIQTILWNKAIKNQWKMIDGYDESDYIGFNDVRVTGDGKTDAGFHWDNMVGAGTGLAQKLAYGEKTDDYETVKTLGGNIASQEIKTYGKWSFRLDSQATKQFQEQGYTVKDVLAKKNVELMK